MILQVVGLGCILPNKKSWESKQNQFTQMPGFECFGNSWLPIEKTGTPENSQEPRKKGPLVDWVITGDGILPSYIGIKMNHVKDPY